MLKALFKAARAIAIAAGPRFGAIFVPAVFAAVRVLHFQQVKIFFPIRTFLSQWNGAEARFHPVRHAVFAETRLFHVVDIFIARDGTAAERTIADGREQGFFLARFDTGFDQVTHGET